MAAHRTLNLVGRRTARSESSERDSYFLHGSLWESYDHTADHCPPPVWQLAWPFIANFSCASSSDCPRSSNMGWRYTLWTMGALMMVLFVLRFFVFHLYESPKYLMGRGRDEEAVAVIHTIAKYNGKTSSLTLNMLKEVETVAFADASAEKAKAKAKLGLDTSARGAIRRKLALVDTSHVKALFVTKRMAYSTSLLLILWGASFRFLSAGTRIGWLIRIDSSVHRACVSIVSL